MNKVFKHLKENWIRHGFETLVVTVGILGAFALNNWNEDRKEKIIELEALSNIREGLIADTLEINRIMGQLERGNSFCQAFQNAVDPATSGTTEKVENFRMLSLQMRFDPVGDPYNYLESKGFGLVKDSKLRSAIIKIYNHDHDEINKVVTNYNRNLLDYRRPLTRKYFRIKAEPLLMIPYDYDKTIQSKELYNEVSIMKSNNNALQTRLLALKEDVVDLIHEIEKYVDN